jgi:hypothetical protein
MAAPLKSHADPAAASRFNRPSPQVCWQRLRESAGHRWRRFRPTAAFSSPWLHRLARIVGNGICTIIVEPEVRTRPHGARDRLRDGPRHYVDRSRQPRIVDSAHIQVDPTVLGAVAEFDMAMKLKGTWDRATRERGKCEGRKALGETGSRVGRVGACAASQPERLPSVGERSC